MAYRFIYENSSLFGTRWLLRHLKIYPNAYYSFLKNRKEAYNTRKQYIFSQIQDIYHTHNGIDGYRNMQIYLKRQGIALSTLTVHKYMNTELGLTAIVRRKRPGYRKSKPHKVFANLIQQNFSAAKVNQKWCTDFTYLFLQDGRKYYNCSIIDLHDRSVVASITDKNITSDLAIRTVKKALENQPKLKGELILHSDQGSQFTSKEFIDFCTNTKITQSMSKAGYPYDNSPMERYFNTLKNELIYLHEYKSGNELISSIEDFAFVWYNHVRPHSFNDYKTPFEARYGIQNY